MLQVKSFTFDQEKEINHLLQNYRLAAGASIFVSDGKIILPYEDGEPKNAAQGIIDYKVQINEMAGQIEVITHSNKVMADMIADLHQKLTVAEADYKATPNMKEKEQLVKALKEQISGNHAQVRQNDYEIKRLQRNIELFENSIVELSA